MEYLDPVKNLLSTNIAVAPSPASTGTTFTVTTGQGVNFPDPLTDGQYNLVICPAGAAPTPTNSTIVRVTARDGDEFTVVRDVEDSNTRSIVVDDVVAMNITAKMMEDIDDTLATKTDNQTTQEIVTVGSTGDFATINDALSYLTQKHPNYNDGTDTRAIIRLQDGFIMQEQVLINGQELGWITIESESGTGQSIESFAAGTEITDYARPEITRVRISYSVTYTQDEDEYGDPVGDPYVAEGDGADVLNGSWVSLELPTAAKHYFWFNVDGGATDPALSGTGHEVVVTDEEVEAPTAAEALKTAITAVTGFTATRDGQYVTVNNDADGAVTTATKNGIPDISIMQTGRDTGYRVKITITGHGLTNGDRIVIRDHAGDVEEVDYNGVWYVADATADDFHLDYASNPDAVYSASRAGSEVSGEVVSPEPVVASREALTQTWEFFYQPAFGVARGTLPTIGCEFEMDETGDNPYMSYKDGLCATDQGKINIMPFCGFSNAGGCNIYGTRSSIINANDAIANDAGRHGVWAYSNTIINARRVEAKDCGWAGVSEDEGNGFDDMNRPVGCGMVATRLSIINAEGAVATGSQGDNFLAEFGGQINCEGHDSNATVGTSTNGLDFNVRRGIIYQGDGVIMPNRGGWDYISVPLTFNSVDDPTGVINCAGANTFLSAGMRVKFDNDANTIYGIITAVTSTTFTFLHEMSSSVALTLMADSAITNAYYSAQQTPLGFPRETWKWRLGGSVENKYISWPASGLHFFDTTTDLPIAPWLISCSFLWHDRITSDSNSKRLRMQLYRGTTRINRLWQRDHDKGGTHDGFIHVSCANIPFNNEAKDILRVGADKVTGESWDEMGTASSGSIEATCAYL